MGAGECQDAPRATARGQRVDTIPGAQEAVGVELQHPLPMEVPVSSRRLVATGMGFSLHAGTAVHGKDRQGLERLCRAPDCRLRLFEDGRNEYTPKRGSPFILSPAAPEKRR